VAYIDVGQTGMLLSFSIIRLYSIGVCLGVCVCVCVCVQFWLVMHYLSKMTDEQTLVMYSGHPLGLFPSDRDAPRAVITNGMVCLSVCLSV